MNKKIVFFGTEDFSARFLTALLKAEYTIAAVVTKPDAKKGRGKKIAMPKVKTIALEYGVNVLQPEHLEECIPDITRLGGAAAVLVSYGKIVPKQLIDCFQPGIINVHPSLLPKYRGPSPVESAIVHGDTETGVSIMKLEAAMDAGPIYTQSHVSLTGNESKAALYKTVGDIAETELLRILPAILDGSLQPTPQDTSKATYCHLIKKSDGILDQKKYTADEAERRVRAYVGFPKTRIDINGHTIIVTKSHRSDVKEDPLDLAFADETILSIDELIAPSGKKMNAQAFIRGYKI